MSYTGSREGWISGTGPGIFIMNSGLSEIATVDGSSVHHTFISGSQTHVLAGGREGYYNGISEGLFIIFTAPNYNIQYIGSKQ